MTFTLDATSPVVVITSPVDGSLTKVNVTVSGRTTDNLSGVAKLEAQVDTGVFVPVSFDTTGAYSFATQLPGGRDSRWNAHVNLRATDQAGNVSTLTGVSFASTRLRLPLTISLDPSTDSAPVGDDQTTFATVILVGQTEAKLPATLIETGATTTADGTGQFSFGGVSLALGPSVPRPGDRRRRNVGTGEDTIMRIAGPDSARDHRQPRPRHRTRGETNSDGVTLTRPLRAR